MTANPSDAARDLDSDPQHDALADPYDKRADPVDAEAADTPVPVDPTTDNRSAAEIAEEREIRDAGSDAGAAPAPAIPAVPKWVVPAVSAVLVFLLLAFPLGWTLWGAALGALVAAAISYAFVFRL